MKSSVRSRIERLREARAYDTIIIRTAEFARPPGVPDEPIVMRVPRKRTGRKLKPLRIGEGRHGA